LSGDPLAGWLAGWLDGWLAGWLAGWLNERATHSETLLTRAMWAIRESNFLDLEKQRYLSVCHLRLLRELSLTGQVRLFVYTQLMRSKARSVVAEIAVAVLMLIL